MSRARRDRDEPAYWRECEKCGIADVTAAAVGQDVATPNEIDLS